MNIAINKNKVEFVKDKLKFQIVKGKRDTISNCSKGLLITINIRII